MSTEQRFGVGDRVRIGETDGTLPAFWGVEGVVVSVETHGDERANTVSLSRETNGANVLQLADADLEPVEPSLTVDAGSPQPYRVVLKDESVLDVLAYDISTYAGWLKLVYADDTITGIFAPGTWHGVTLISALVD